MKKRKGIVGLLAMVLTLIVSVGSVTMASETNLVNATNQPVVQEELVNPIATEENFYNKVAFLERRVMVGDVINGMTIEGIYPKVVIEVESVIPHRFVYLFDVIDENDCCLSIGGLNSGLNEIDMHPPIFYRDVQTQFISPTSPLVLSQWVHARHFNCWFFGHVEGRIIDMQSFGHGIFVTVEFTGWLHYSHCVQ